MADNTPQKRKGDEGGQLKKTAFDADRSATESSTVMVMSFAFEILKHYQAKEFQEALRLIDQFYSLPPTHPQFRQECFRTQFKIIQASCWSSLGINQEESNKILQNILHIDPNNSFAHYAFGVMTYNNGDFRGSIKYFDRAVELNAPSMRRAMEYRAKAATLDDLMNSGKAFLFLCIRADFIFILQQTMSTSKIDSCK